MSVKLGPSNVRFILGLPCTGSRQARQSACLRLLLSAWLGLLTTQPYVAFVVAQIGITWCFWALPMGRQAALEVRGTATWIRLHSLSVKPPHAFGPGHGDIPCLKLGISLLIWPHEDQNIQQGRRQAAANSSLPASPSPPATSRGKFSLRQARTLALFAQQLAHKAPPDRLYMATGRKFFSSNMLPAVIFAVLGTLTSWISHQAAGTAPLCSHLSIIFE